MLFKVTSFIIPIAVLHFVTSQLVVNVKNNGGEVFKESIQANTSLDTITLEFQKTDGTSVTQFIDYRNVKYKSFSNRCWFHADQIVVNLSDKIQRT